MYHVQKHFHPLTSWSLFSPEQELTPPPTTQQILFPFSGEEVVGVGSLPLFVNESLPAQSPSLIPKPTGSFDLKSFTKWTNETFFEVQTYVNHLVEEHLDTTIVLSQQPQDKLNTIYFAASEQYHELKAFQANWVTTELIKLKLRCTVQNFSRKKT